MDSVLVGAGDLKLSYRLLRGKGVKNAMDGIVYKNVVASYTHLHALGVPQWAEAFVALMARSKISAAEIRSGQRVGAYGQIC